MNACFRPLTSTLFNALLLLSLATAHSVHAQTQATPPKNDPDQQEWVQLFNGRNLDGWHPKITGYPLDENFGNTFRVVDGLLTVSYDKYDEFRNRFGHLFYKQPFSYYRLHVEYRFVGDQVKGGPGWATRNSGMMVHGQTPESMGKDQNFPISIEVQLLGGLGQGDRPTGSLCTPGTHVVVDSKLATQHCITSQADTFHGDQWVSAEVVALGNAEITHIINGKQVHRYVMPQVGGPNVSNHNPAAKVDGTLLHGGSISLQSESHPVQFRKVEILNLEGCMDEKASNYKRYYVKANNAACVYQ
jgi:hypothetical protein